MKRLIAAITFFLLSLVLSAKPININQQQREQQKKIQSGIVNGMLTSKEAAKLELQQAKINHAKKMAKSDGIVTAQERICIIKEQKHADHCIFIEKHDAQHR